ncbi:MAG TPA: allantoinase AllB [bacterium]|nr:allantoinase AllB [bacterium]
MKAETAIVGGMVATHTAVFPATVMIAGGRIAALLDPGERPDAEEVIDATGRLVLPGCVDPHVHFNEPGRTHWEGFGAGTRSAAAGGVTTVIEMPLNAVPPTTDAAAFALKAAAVTQSAVVDCALWGGLVPGNVDALEGLREAGVAGYKAFMADSGTEFARADDGVLWEGMKRIAVWGGVVGVHAESNELALSLRARLEGAGRRDSRAWGESRPPEVELGAIQRALLLAGSAGCRLHIVHLSIPQGAARIASARARQNVTVETCPHYLLLDEEAAARLGPVAKCAPPLRPRAAVDGLWREVADGTIDCIASDHSPCPLEEKTRGADDIWAAWGGITGVQTLLPLLVWEGVRRRGLPLERLVALTSTNAARIFGLFPRKGSLLPGADADVVLFDYHREWTISADRLLYRHPWTPYLGWRIVGAVDKVLVRGRLVFAEGEVMSPPGSGRLIRPG